MSGASSAAKWRLLRGAGGSCERLLLAACVSDLEGVDEHFSYGADWLVHWHPQLSWEFAAISASQTQFTPPLHAPACWQLVSVTELELLKQSSFMLHSD